jgi:hypothetical protein
VGYAIRDDAAEYAQCVEVAFVATLITGTDCRPSLGAMIDLAAPEGAVGPRGGPANLILVAA